MWIIAATKTIYTNVPVKLKSYWTGANTGCGARHLAKIYSTQEEANAELAVAENAYRGFARVYSFALEKVPLQSAQDSVKME
jgi:hypothetical protein